MPHNITAFSFKTGKKFRQRLNMSLFFLHSRPFSTIFLPTPYHLLIMSLSCPYHVLMIPDPCLYFLSRYKQGDYTNLIKKYTPSLERRKTILFGKIFHKTAMNYLQNIAYLPTKKITELRLFIIKQINNQQDVDNFSIRFL